MGNMRVFIQKLFTRLCFCGKINRKHYLEDGCMNSTTTESTGAVQAAQAEGTGRKRKDMRRVRSASPMAVITPFIMVNRVGAMNLMRDRIAVTRLEKYVNERKANGMPNLTVMHVLIAAYVRLVSQRPAFNRFIRGQRIWTRRSVEIALTIKKEMSLESPDTVIKITLYPDATLSDVYREFDRVINEYRSSPGGSFDDTAKVLSYIPSLVLKNAIWLLKTLDYFGLLPGFLAGVSPFHCSMFITSMASLSIPPIYHHLYDFGTCPLFISFGAKKREYKVNPDGSVYKERYMDITFACDERICDGYYYASGLRLYKAILKDPSQLDAPPEEVLSDAE